MTLRRAPAGIIVIIPIMDTTLLLSTPTGAAAAPTAATKSTDQGTRDPASIPFSSDEYSSPVARLSAEEYAAHRAAAERALTTPELHTLASSTCFSWTRSRYKDNVYGGTLYRINGTINWCQDGSSVWGGSYSWSTYTNFGWSFNKWSNSPTGYYRRSPRLAWRSWLSKLLE